MAVVLAIRPYGFFGRAEIVGGTHAVGIASRKPLPGRTYILLVVIAALAAFPLVADAYLLKVATEILIFALFAFSLQLLIGVGGLVSFGHAAFFGLGAYGAALAVKWYGASMEAALPARLASGGLGRGADRRLRGAPLRHLSRHDDARRRADPLRGRLPMGRRDRRRQRHRRRLAVGLGERTSRRITL